MVTFDDKYANAKLTSLRTQEEERLIQAKAPQLGYEYINLQGYTINPEALMVIPEKKAKDAELVAFEKNQSTLSIAAKNPSSPQTQALLQELQTRNFIPVVYICSTASLLHGWDRYKDLNASSEEKKGVFEISSDDIVRLTKEIKQKEDILKTLDSINNLGNTRRISETLELIFAGGLALGASDVHIEPEESGIRLRYRFDGVLHDITDLDIYIYKRLMSRLKLLSGMILNAHQQAQDGRFTFSIGDREIEVRSSVIPGALGESIVMRLLDPSVASFSLDKIKLNPDIEAIMRQQLKKPNGLIITTGPTGSGKTTALYAFLRETHSEGVKIITIENPVEYKLDGIVQTQTDKNYTFASGLRAILRQDPDIIMVGEIRDHEVAETAIHAAQTGHLVFTTLHTNSAVAGFVRLIDLGVDPRIMGTSINVIIGQRLIRLLCEKCKQSYQASPEETALIKQVMSTHPRPTPVSDPVTLYRPGGCAVCGNSGYKGRVGIFEAVVMDEAVEEVVIRDPREHVIADAARPQGIPTMVEDGIGKALAGITSIKELERVVELPTVLQNTQTNDTNTTPPDTVVTGEDDFLKHIV
jgi:type IV pilus assembly protein PilB